MKPILTFETKDQYLAWRTEWRARYKEISQDIHDIKLAVRACQSGVGRERWAPQRDRITATIKRVCAEKTGQPALWALLYVLTELRAEAREMLEWRKAAKLRAQEQYLKSRSSGVPS